MWTWNCGALKIAAVSFVSKWTHSVGQLRLLLFGYLNFRIFRHDFLRGRLFARTILWVERRLQRFQCRFVNFDLICNKGVRFIFGMMHRLDDGLKKACLTSINLVLGKWRLLMWNCWGNFQATWVVLVFKHGMGILCRFFYSIFFWLRRICLNRVKQIFIFAKWRVNLRIWRD